MRILYYLFLLAVILFCATFATLNLQNVSVNYYVAQREMPLALLLAFTFGGGCVIGLVFGFWMLIKSKIKQFRLRQRLTLAERELENLRAIPLRDIP
jgi:lipopolysaccharide assembly protein A